MNIKFVIKINLTKKKFVKALIKAIMLSQWVCVDIIEWTCLSFPKEKLGTFSRFKFPIIFKGELYKLKAVLLEML